MQSMLGTPNKFTLHYGHLTCLTTCDIHVERGMVQVYVEVSKYFLPCLFRLAHFHSFTGPGQSFLTNTRWLKNRVSLRLKQDLIINPGGKPQ